ncbi:hypothetical protein HFU84_03860 [Acidithiobacillus sp. CV18-2]|uniref:Uncharacterized protein n=1 Tax=Igneacidithiobacillus copahuensis TaxID=2724909 RepID=A0AAE3CL16_9PROT|nr:hypothetical protein [Igneacidithiobacillus copahuensis]MBU2755031.1 hypothetical protein [Acidithiobacillus sp. CV18-3]MBU2757977.1 hypothetical protein [Acidithiobacillus sp. BN09-2]MBU2776650.1 hypothetical protein [Acidithiobacillus sp. CV18-2]MBU2796146.1 hypothetical protein [Acidithiobacillus sp. VAN18-2]MBU2789065.1 hypothetical protein [Igneacidithiobacillus copahuensis]
MIKTLVIAVAVLLAPTIAGAADWYVYNGMTHSCRAAAALASAKDFLAFATPYS